MLDSRGSRFAEVGHRRDLAERVLIETFHPCLNVSLNSTATPLPQGLLPFNAALRWGVSYKRMLREARVIAEKLERELTTDW